jgi:hypothetical protein
MAGLLLIVLVSVAAAPPAPQVHGAGVAAASVCEAFTGTGGLEGRVTSPGGTPHIYLDVTLYTASGRYLRSVATDSAGGYRFSGLAAGSYLVHTTAPYSTLYAPEWFDNQTEPTSATAIEVTEGMTATADIELTLGSWIAGRVTGSDGGPLPDVSVGVYDRRGDRVAIGLTDISGHYTTSPGLVSGEYTLHFSSPHGLPYFGEFYADQTDPQAATPISVTAPNPVGDLNGVLERGAQITGRATLAATGDPVQAQIAIIGEDSRDYAYTDANGYYTTTALHTGTYTVRFYRSNDDINLYGSTHGVSLTAPTSLANVDGVFLPGGLITGQVTDAEGAAADGGRVQASSADRDSELYAYAYPDASGTYTVTGLPSGDYWLRFSYADHLTEYYDDALNYPQRDPVAVTAPNTTAGVNAALAAAGSITGTVTAADTGLPLAGVSMRADSVGGEAAGSATTDAAGRYKINYLPSGEYRVSFAPSGSGAACAYQREWHSGQSSQAAADIVTVTAPAVTPNVDAVLERGSILAGRVVEANTGAPLENVYVTVLDGDGKELAWGLTNLLGHYQTSPALPSGTYWLHFAEYEQGYADEYYANALTLAAAQPVDVKAPGDLTGVDATLALGGLISGRVIAGDTGTPLADVNVTVYAAGGEQVAYAYTDSEGRYTVRDGLATGSYRLGFSLDLNQGPGLGIRAATAPALDEPGAPGPGSWQGETRGEGPEAEAALEALFELARLAPRITGGSAPPSGYLPLFYNGQHSLTAADLVAVAAPGETTGVDTAFLRGVFMPLMSR